MVDNVINIIEIKNSFNKTEFIVLDTSRKKIGELKKHDSVIKKIINFHLRVKLPSTFFLYNDGFVTHEYSKNGNCVYIKDVANGIIEDITRTKKLGDCSYKWGNKHFEVTSVYQTSVVIKQDKKTIGQISFEHTKNELFNTETVISINVCHEHPEIIPIVILIFANEFYQNNIGGKSSF